MEAPFETVYDPIRKARVKRTPEEEVRQSVVYYLTTQLGYPPELLANEASITVGKVRRRCDTVVFDPRSRTPLMILEYKAPAVSLTEETLKQALEYNSVLGAKVIVLTNGRVISVCRLPSEGRAAEYLQALPPFKELSSESF